MIQRPERLKDYVGQARVKALLGAELAGGAFPRHILLYSQPGLGKTTIARIVANEAGLEFVNWKASKTLTPRRLIADLYALPTTGYDKGGNAGKHAPRYAVFIDEIHLLSEYETLYSPLEDRVLNPDPFGGVSWLPHVCFICATTNVNALPEPFKARFPNKWRLEPYTCSDLAAMLRTMDLSKGEVAEVARRARGNARECLNLAESVKRHGLGYFNTMGIDERGLNDLDRRVLAILETAGRPLSLQTLAAMAREDPVTIRDRVEPYLLELGLLEITARGRQALTCGGGSRGALTGGYAV